MSQVGLVKNRKRSRKQEDDEEAREVERIQHEYTRLMLGVRRSHSKLESAHDDDDDAMMDAPGNEAPAIQKSGVVVKSQPRERDENKDEHRDKRGKDSHTDDQTQHTTYTPMYHAELVQCYDSLRSEKPHLWEQIRDRRDRASPVALVPLLKRLNMTPHEGKGSLLSNCTKLLRSPY